MSEQQIASATVTKYPIKEALKKTKRSHEDNPTLEQNSRKEAAMPSRISGACIACRSKKQKCSGDRAGCTQCRAAGNECTWPEQRKRGPAKGYIEGLEHRLHEAEQLLLQILPILSTEQLAAVTDYSHNDDGAEHSASPSRRATPPLLNKKIGIEYWEQFPLDSAVNIRRWQQDCAEGGRARRQTQRQDSETEQQEQQQRRRTSEQEAAQQLQYLSEQKDSGAEPPRLSAIDRNSGAWSTLCQDPVSVSVSVSSAAPVAWPAGMDINNMVFPPWDQHDQQIQNHIALAGQQHQSSRMQVDVDPKRYSSQQQSGSVFFPPDSQRQYFW